MKHTILAISLLTALTVTVVAQQPDQPVKTLQQIAKDTDIKTFIPDPQVAAKLSTEEQEAIKLHLTQVMAATMRLGYQNGAQDSSKFLLGEFAKFAAEQQAAAAKQSKPSKLDRFAAAFGAFSHNVQQANTNRINCVSNRIGNFTYTNCY